MRRASAIAVVGWFFVSTQATGHYGRQQTIQYGPFANKGQCEQMQEWLKLHNTEVVYHRRDQKTGELLYDPHLSWCWWDGK